MVGAAIDRAVGYNTGNDEYHPTAGDFPGCNMTPMYMLVRAR